MASVLVVVAGARVLSRVQEDASLFVGACPISCLTQNADARAASSGLNLNRPWARSLASPKDRMFLRGLVPQIVLIRVGAKGKREMLVPD